MTNAEAPTPINLEAVHARAEDARRGLREVVALIRAAEGSAQRLATVGAEHGAAAEQGRASAEALAASLEQTAATGAALARSQTVAGESIKELQQGAEGAAASLGGSSR